MINPVFANLLTEPVGVSHFVLVGAFMFTCGVLCMATKRNALGILMGIEMVLNGGETSTSSPLAAVICATTSIRSAWMGS